MHNFPCPKNQYKLFLKKLNGERLVNLKYKPPENKEITKISGVTTTDKMDVLKIKRKCLGGYLEPA